jgi:hypothetical protein
VPARNKIALKETAAQTRRIIESAKLDAHSALVTQIRLRSSH